MEDKEVTDVNKYWMELRDSLKETGEEVLGVARNKEEWISEESWTKLRERKELKEELTKENLVAE